QRNAAAQLHAATSRTAPHTAYCDSWAGRPCHSSCQGQGYVWSEDGLFMHPSDGCINRPSSVLTRCCAGVCSLATIGHRFIYNSTLLCLQRMVRFCGLARFSEKTIGSF